MNKKQQAKVYLETAITNLREAYTLIDELNTKDAQFDYVSDPRLSDLVDRAENLTSKIEKIVYQK